MASDKNLLIIAKNSPDELAQKLHLRSEGYNWANTPETALQQIVAPTTEIVLATSTVLQEIFHYASREDQNYILDLMPTGICFVNLNHEIIWYNRHFKTWLPQKDQNGIGSDFYQIFGPETELEGPDFCPFHTVSSTQERTLTRLRNDRHVFEMNVSPIWDRQTRQLKHYIVELRDITDIIKVDEILRQLQDVGRQLSDLSSEELQSLSLEARHELLKQRIKNFLTKILHYEMIEIRLLDEKTGHWEPFLSYGIDRESASWNLHTGDTIENIVIDYVADNNVPYICEDTLEHPFYPLSANVSQKVRSSLTVPLSYRDKVIGICHIESLVPHAFNERDQYFLQLFAKDISVALHTFNLLNYENEHATQEKSRSLLRLVASPIDSIIQETSSLLHKYAHEPSLQQILTNARKIKTLISPARAQLADHPLLIQRRILIIDRDPEIRQSAHDLLTEYYCEVETAADVLTALTMIEVSHYDVVISEIKPDGGMNGYQLMLRLQELWPEKKTAPLLLMTEFGYDGNHTIINARANGLIGYFLKPFDDKPRVCERILNMLEEVIRKCGERDKYGQLIMPVSTNELPQKSPQNFGKIQTIANQGFYQREGSKFFDTWARLTQNQFRNIKPDEDSGTADDSAIEAT